VRGEATINKIRYIGSFKNLLLEGPGKIIYSQNEFYEGPVRNGKRHGEDAVLRKSDENGT
jgi:hypothetical protein